MEDKLVLKADWFVPSNPEQTYVGDFTFERGEYAELMIHETIMDGEFHVTLSQI